GRRGWASLDQGPPSEARRGPGRAGPHRARRRRRRQRRPAVGPAATAGHGLPARPAERGLERRQRLRFWAQGRRGNPLPRRACPAQRANRGAAAAGFPAPVVGALRQPRHRSARPVARRVRPATPPVTGHDYVRVGETFHGVLTSPDGRTISSRMVTVQDIWLRSILGAKRFIYLEDQYLISDC